jgi:hypothetical protein
MSSLRKKSFIVGGCVLLCLAGCAQKPAEVKVASVGSPAPAAAPAPLPMPSYPILLVDLPRQQMGLPVAPARSRLPAGSERDLDGPAPTLARPAAPLIRAAAASLVPAAPPTRREPIDTRYVP